MRKKYSKHRMYRDIQFEKIAKEFRLAYTYNDNFGVVKLLRDFKLFRRFSNNKITNILEEKTALNESNFRIFDFQYSIWNGETEEVFTQTVFFAQSKQLALPHFYMEPGRLFKQVGNEQMDFKAFSPFSNQYWLKGELKGQTPNAVTDDLRYYFSSEEDWCFEGLNYFLIIYKKDKIIPSTDLMDFYQKGKEIVELFTKTK